MWLCFGRLKLPASFCRCVLDEVMTCSIEAIDVVVFEHPGYMSFEAY